MFIGRLHNMMAQSSFVLICICYLGAGVPVKIYMCTGKLRSGLNVSKNNSTYNSLLIELAHLSY